MFRLTLAREPSEAELAATLAVDERFGATAVGRALFNANEFLFLP